MTHMPFDPDATQPIAQPQPVAGYPHVASAASPSRTRGVLACVAAALVVLGTFLPWVQVTAPFLGTVTKSGMDGSDGPVFLVAGAVLAGYGVHSLRGRNHLWFLIVAALDALAVLGLLAAEVNAISDARADIRAQMTADPEDLGAAMADAVHVSAGSGLWAIGIAGLVALAAVWLGIKARRSHRVG